jgi:hypothetical protein
MAAGLLAHTTYETQRGGDSAAAAQVGTSSKAGLAPCFCTCAHVYTLQDIPLLVCAQLSTWAVQAVHGHA